MADPVLVPCPADQWTKVATAVTIGQIWKQRTDLEYWQTYRATGGAAPSDLTDAQAWVGQSAKISAPSAIDVYIYPKKKAGSVRVDL